jgi:hypothetical protein
VFPNPEPLEHGERGYEPTQPRWGVGELARKLFAPVIALGFLIVKFGGFLLKFKVVTTGASTSSFPTALASATCGTRSRSATSLTGSSSR